MSYHNQFACSFESMIEDILYPIFRKRFGKRFIHLQEKETFTVKSVKDCNEHGPDCRVALSVVKMLLQKMFRKYHVLNRDFSTTTSSSGISNQRYHGTVIANMNLLL